MEVKFHLAEVGLRVFQEGTEAGKYRAHFGEHCIWFGCNIVYMSGNDAQVACWLVKTEGSCVSILKGCF